MARQKGNTTGDPEWDALIIKGAEDIARQADKSAEKLEEEAGKTYDKEKPFIDAMKAYKRD